MKTMANFGTKLQLNSNIFLSVTEFSWAVSQVLNYVKKHKHPVHITRRNEVVAVITPVEDNNSNFSNSYSMDESKGCKYDD